MKILAINSSFRPDGTSAHLTEKALEGAATEGADTEMILLTEKNIQFCTNCLSCYKDTESEIAPCTIDDDVHGILEKIRDADGVLFTSPVHCGFVSSLMAAFVERATWTLLRPTGEMEGLKGAPEPRLTDKSRAVATLVSAGGVPPEMRKSCDLGSPWLQDFGVMVCNGECIGDMYAGALFNKELQGDEWNRAYFFRELTNDQFREAYDLGANLAKAVKGGKVKPFDLGQLKM